MTKPLSLLAVILLAIIIILTGCQTGVSSESYDRLNEQLEQAQSSLAQAENDLDALQAEKDSRETELQSEITALQARNTDLEAQVAALREQYELDGGTVAEQVEKIVKYYHETHVYSTWDLFVCSDMAAEVWNMLKARGISAVIAVGDIEKSIDDIVKSTHAWVLAEVAPGEYLALETTGGRVVTRSENPLYYRGWSFESPAKIKDYTRLIWEYNIRVDIHNDILAEDIAVVEAHNQTSNPQIAAELAAVHEKLEELIQEQQAVLHDLMEQINSLAMVLN